MGHSRPEASSSASAALPGTAMAADMDMVEEASKAAEQSQ